MASAITNVVSPADRPRNIVYNKILDTAADVDVALRVITVITMDKKHFAAINTTGETAFLLSADELIDCCDHGCVFVQNDDPTGTREKPISWHVDPDTGIAYADMAYYDGTNNVLVCEYVCSAEAYSVK